MTNRTYKGMICGQSVETPVWEDGVMSIKNRIRAVRLVEETGLGVDWLAQVRTGKHRGEMTHINPADVIVFTDRDGSTQKKGVAKKEDAWEDGWHEKENDDAQK